MSCRPVKITASILLGLSFMVCAIASPTCADPALDDANRAAAAEAAAEEAAWIKRNHAALAEQMNSMFAGKHVRKSWTCSTKPDEATGCDEDEYQGANWWSREHAEPRAVRFETSPGGDTILFYETGDAEPLAGTAAGPDPNRIVWTGAGGALRTIRFWPGENGSAMYEVSDSPVHRGHPEFDPLARFQYWKHEANAPSDEAGLPVSTS